MKNLWLNSKNNKKKFKDRKYRNNKKLRYKNKKIKLFKQSKNINLDH